MECAKSFSITVDAAPVCPSLLDTFVIVNLLEGIAGMKQSTGLIYVVPSWVVDPTNIYQLQLNGFLSSVVPLTAGSEKCGWIEYIPSTNNYHLVVFDSGTGDPIVQIMDVGGTMGGQIIPPDQDWSPISYDTTINRSFMYGGLSNLLEFNGDAVDRTIPIGTDTQRVAYANGKIYCPNTVIASSEVVVINYATAAIMAPIALVGDAIWALAVGTKVFVVLRFAPARIVVIDSLTDTVTNTIAVDAGSLSSSQLSYLPSTGLMYLFTSIGGYAIDPVTESVLCQFTGAVPTGNEYALYDNGPAIFVPEFNTLNVRKFG